MDQVKAQFEAISQLAESEFRGALTFHSRMNHFVVVYNFALQDERNSGILYSDFHELLTSFALRAQIDPRLRGYELFQQIVKVWKNFKPIQRWATITFGYLSRFYIPLNNKMPLHFASMSIFFERIFCLHEGVVRDCLFELILRERRGELFDRELLQQGIEMYSAMEVDGASSVFRDNFMKPFIIQTAQFFRQESAQWAANDTAIEYLQKVETQLFDEKARCLKYFSMSEEKTIMDCVETCLLDTEAAVKLLFYSRSGLASHVAARDTDTLSRYYKLFAHRLDGIKRMAQIVKERLLAEATEIAKRFGVVEKSIDATACVSALVALQEEYAAPLHAFAHHPLMAKAVREGFETALSNGISVTSANGTSSMPFGELLATCGDQLLQAPDEQTENQLDKLIILLGYVSDKDSFQMHTRELLAKRLLTFNHKFNDALERYFISKMKQRCGVHFVTPFEGMMNDAASSSVFSAKLAEASSLTPLPFDCHVMVLRMGIWPKLIAEEHAMPPKAIRDAMQRIELFHRTETKQRVLRWSHVSSNMTVIARLKNGVKEFQMAGYQGWVLLLFSEQNTVTVSAMMETLGLDMEDLKRALPAFAKLKLLQRKAGTSSQSMHPTDTFILNTEFAHPHRKLQVPVGQPRISVSNSLRIAKMVEDDRKPVIDSCIIRIMKSRKQMSHQELMSECMQQLSSRFAPDPKVIKIRIEDLMKREYIERVENNSNAYRYLA